MATGKVKWFNHAKGFGFIVPESGDDLFVHVTNIYHADRKRINDGDTVEFFTRSGRRGQYAYCVRILTMETKEEQEERVAYNRKFDEYDWDRTWSMNQINHAETWGVIGCLKRQMRDSVAWSNQLRYHVERWSPHYVPPKSKSNGITGHGDQSWFDDDKYI